MYLKCICLLLIMFRRMLNDNDNDNDNNNDNGYIYIFCNGCLICIKNIIHFIKHCNTVLLFYMGWVFLHYICSHFYTYYCVPYTWYGLIISPFLITTPHCGAFRWVISESGAIFYTMWISIGTWICTKLLTFRPLQNE